MFENLQPYQKYKDSGLEWLGDIPEHWQIRRLKMVCRLAYGDSLSSGLRLHGDVAVYGSNGCVGTHVTANTGSPCIIVGRKGSFGKVKYSPTKVYAIDTTFFVDDRHTTNHMRWLYFLLSWLQLDHVTKDSAIPGLNREDTYQRLITLPQLSEQAAIARFLDHVTNKIDPLIRAIEKLIELLEELKQSTIREAVTGQIDVRSGMPYPKYKDSGVEWLGEVPKHWNMRKLRQLLKGVNERHRADLPLLSVVRKNGVILRDVFNREENHNFIPDDLYLR